MLGGMQQFERQISVVGEEQQTHGIQIQASHREDARQMPGHQAHDRVPALGVGDGGDVAGRLVEHPVMKTRGQHHRFPVHQHLVARFQARSQCHNQRVHLNASFLNELFAGPPGAHSAAGQIFLNPFLHRENYRVPGRASCRSRIIAER